MSDYIVTVCAHCGAKFTEGLWWHNVSFREGETTPGRPTSAPFQFKPGQCPRCRKISPVGNVQRVTWQTA